STITYQSISTGPASGSSGILWLFTQSTALGGIAGTGDLTTSASGAGASAGNILVAAPRGSMTSNGSILANGTVNAGAGNVLIDTVSGFSLLGAASTVSASNSDLSGGTAGNITLIAPVGNINLAVGPLSFASGAGNNGGNFVGVAGADFIIN